MKLPLCSALGFSLLFVSCKSTDPEYEAYKQQREAANQVAGQAPYGPNADPYGAPNAPVGSEVGAYTPAPPAPYQPLPSINPSPDPLGPAPSPAPGSFPPTIGSVAPGNTSPHTVVAGDNLWGLARRYGTSVEAIKQANGMSSDKIMSGTTIQIPRN